MAAKYVLKPTSDRQYLFNLQASNGQVILISERYTSKSGAQNGIASVRENSPLDERYERLTSTNGQPYFVLRAANHEIIGTSELYSSAFAMETGIRSVKENGPSATVDDQTESAGSASS